MTRITSILCTLGLSITIFADRLHGQSHPLAITHVTIIDVQAGVPKRNWTVFISNGRIVKMQPSHGEIPKEFAILNAKGQFLIPGLWDSHVHALWDSNRAALFFPLFIACGVTS